MAPDTHAAVLLPASACASSPVLQCRRRRGWSTSRTRGGRRSARGAAGAAHDSVPGAGGSAPGGRGPAALRGWGGDQATPLSGGTLEGVGALSLC